MKTVAKLFLQRSGFKWVFTLCTLRIGRSEIPLSLSFANEVLICQVRLISSLYKWTQNQGKKKKKKNLLSLLYKIPLVFPYSKEVHVLIASINPH